MEYLFLKHRYTNPSFPNNKVNGWEERYERVNSSSYSSWHESVSRKRLHVTWNVLNSFGSNKDTSSDAVWNDTHSKVINCSQSTEVFPFCSGAEVCSLLSWLAPVLRPETSSHEPGPCCAAGDTFTWFTEDDWDFLWEKWILQIILCFSFDACCSLNDAVFPNTLF